MQKIAADLLITNDGPPLSNAVIIYDDNTGEIIDLLPSTEGLGDVRHVKGVLVPGYINAHCHLELSHLKGTIPSGTGLIPFIQGVVTLRAFPQEEILEKIKIADQEMYDNGIMAVGDISNKADTVATKANSKLRYYTFIEMFDFLQEAQAEATFRQYEEIYQQHALQSTHKKSYVPHAPYSVSQSLFNYVNGQNAQGSTISIHNQELDAENQLFVDKTGQFLQFYKSFNIPLDDFSPIGKSSLHYTMQQLQSNFTLLMVHNTKTTKEEIGRAQIWNQDVYWVTCPNANLYIENTLPKYTDFIDCGAKMCIGTDSLSSNWQLSIFEEMKTIKKYQSSIDDIELIKWATLNGAKALGYDDLGILKKKCASGINLIDVDVQDGRFDLGLARSSTRIM